MFSASILVLALFGPALAPAPHAAEPTVGPQHAELRPIAWREGPHARAPVAIAAPSAAPARAELREPFDVATAQHPTAAVTNDPSALREPFVHPHRQAATPTAAAPTAATRDAAAPASARPDAPSAGSDGLREPAWARK